MRLTDYLIGERLRGVRGYLRYLRPRVQAWRRGGADLSCQQQGDEGHFDIDFKTGAVRYRYEMGIISGPFGEDVAAHMLDWIVARLDKYVHAFLQVAFGDLDPEVAVPIA